MSTKKKLPKVSILIPSYNQETVIYEAVLSAVQQTYENIEVIISDDASTDNTPVILQDLQQKYPDKIKLFLHTHNVGVTKNHTRGLLKCTGDFITFLDGDDVFLPRKIEKQVQFMLDNPNCAISYHDVDVFDSYTGERIYLWSKRFGTIVGDIKTLIRFGNFLPAVSVMVHKKDVPLSGYDTRINVYSDWLLWLSVLKKNGGNICYINEILAKYRRHANNLTNTSKWKFVDQHITLDIVQSTWPQFQIYVKKRRAELQFMESVNALFSRDFKLGYSLFFAALKNGFPSFPWLRLIKREILFFARNKFRSDDILRSIIKF